MIEREVKWWLDALVRFGSRKLSHLTRIRICFWQAIGMPQQSFFFLLWCSTGPDQRSELWRIRDNTNGYVLEPRPVPDCRKQSPFGKYQASCSRNPSVAKLQFGKRSFLVVGLFFGSFFSYSSDSCDWCLKVCRQAKSIGDHVFVTRCANLSYSVNIYTYIYSTFCSFKKMRYNARKASIISFFRFLFGSCFCDEKSSATKIVFEDIHIFVRFHMSWHCVM